MNGERAQLDQLLNRVAAGELDALTPDEIEQLEAHLNDTPGAAERLVDVRAPALALSHVPMPAEAEWDAVFDQVDAASSATTAARAPAPPGHRRLPHVLKAWEPLLAAAAVILLAVVWRLSPVDRPVPDDWDLRLATDVSIDEIEVFGDVTSFVAYSDDGSTVIWVLDEESNEMEGA